MSIDTQDKRRALPGQYLTFSIDDIQYGVPIEIVNEIIAYRMEPTVVPNTPFFVKGVINLRGKIIPVVDLSAKFGMEETKGDRNTVIIIIDVDDMKIGVIVHKVRDVVDLSENQIEVAPDIGIDEQTRFVMAMGKMQEQVVIILDLTLALSREHLADIIDASVDDFYEDEVA